MAKKHARRRYSLPVPKKGATPLEASFGAFDAAYQHGDYPQAVTLAEALVRSYPNSPDAHERHVNVLGQLRRFREAGEAMERVINLTVTPNAAQQLKLALYLVMAGKAKQAVPILEMVLGEQPGHLQALVWLSRAHHQLGNGEEAIKASDLAYAQNPHHEEMLQWRAIILDRLARHDEAVETLKLLLSISPQRRGANNQIATLYVKEGDYQKAEFHYTKEMELGEDGTNGPAYSNLLIAAHYNPEYSGEELASKILEWDQRFAQRSELGRATTPKEPKKRLRIGLLSGGFRLHPVGQMILPALRNLPSEQVELIAYSTSQSVDFLTQQIQQSVQRWEEIDGLDDSQVEQKIRADRIDILIDMNGGGDGTRYSVLTREPAPLIVKWVGGLINTTGLACFDYLLSDNIETPEGVDHIYTEKLIRLPDDYVCYQFPDYAPSTGILPALSNGYVTFGCLNSPAKLSPQLLAEWAILLKEVPGSKLLLRGMQFESARYREKIAGILAEYGIEAYRLVMEKGASHQEFLATYQRIDIALDTWPYSGGLTTCEALMMGVPVVTHVGPTFAGRHSATHLINAGLSELVTDSWEEFRQRAKELANDLPNLAVIRAALRTILLNSPICNGSRFATHLYKALRAIWQRHCEGKLPAALTFNKGGGARFEGDGKSYRLSAAMDVKGEETDWEIDSPIMAIENGTQLATHKDMQRLLGEGYFALLSLDANDSWATVSNLQQCGEFQYYPKVTLGDGQPVELCVGESNDIVVTIPSIALDGIEGLENIDLLALNGEQDSLAILEHGGQALSRTLLIQVQVKFNPKHNTRSDLGSLTRWASEHGFRFHRLHNIEYRSYMPEAIYGELQQATEMVSADAVYVPTSERITTFSNDQKVKLACALHNLYGVKDLAYELISQVDAEKAELYLASNKGLRKSSAVFSHERSGAYDVARYYESCILEKYKPNHSLPGKLVVSLTSYKARFSTLHLTLKTLLCQSMMPDELVLWIAHEEKEFLPSKVKDLEAYGLRILFCEDVKSYKKIIPALRQYPDSFIVTADDDICYKSEWLQTLVESWDGNKKTIIAHRAHKIVLDKDGMPMPYTKWAWEVGSDEPADGLIFPTTGAGTLFPPNIFHKDVSNAQVFMELCPTADDIWLYWMASINGAVAKRSNYNMDLIEWPDQGGFPLWQENIQRGKNDAIISTIISYYGQVWKSRESRVNVSFMYEGERFGFFLPNKDDHIQKILSTKRSFYESEMLEDIRERMGEMNAIFDVGANIGNHTVYLSKFTKASKVFAFEPHPEIFETLSRNVVVNEQDENVVCINAGLSDSLGRATVSYYDDKNIGMSRLSRLESGGVELLRADDIALAEGVTVSLMKIDVEGMELAVLKGSHRILSEDQPVLYIEAGTQKEFIKLKSYLSGYGYTPILRFNATPTYLFVNGA